MVSITMLSSSPPPNEPLPAAPANYLQDVRTPTATDFPLPQNQLQAVAKRDQGVTSPVWPISPVESDFQFEDIVESASAQQPEGRDSPSPQRIRQQQQAAAIKNLSARPSLDSLLTRSLSRATPAEPRSTTPNKLSTTGNFANNGSPEHGDLSRKRSPSFADLFGSKTDSFTARDRIHRESVIVAEVKTNVIIRDEFLFLNDLSQHLSQRYQRPTSCIFVTLDHSACLLFAGSFDSAYVVTISALPTQLQATTNKRNAALMQSFLASSLGVLPDRGVIKFVGVPEEYLATSGTTVLGQVERLQKALVIGSNNPSTSPSTTTAAPISAIANPYTPALSKSNSNTSLYTTSGHHYNTSAANGHTANNFSGSTVANSAHESRPGSASTAATTADEQLNSTFTTSSHLYHSASMTFSTRSRRPSIRSNRPGKLSLVPKLGSRSRSGSTSGTRPSSPTLTFKSAMQTPASSVPPTPRGYGFSYSKDADRDRDRDCGRDWPQEEEDFTRTDERNAYDRRVEKLQRQRLGSAGGGGGAGGSMRKSFFGLFRR